MAETNGAVVARLIASQGWAPPIVLSDTDVEAIIGPMRRGRSYAAVLRGFRELAGRERFDQIHYAHDLVGRVPELCVNAYPEAERIVFGDALGSVYHKRYTLALAAGATALEARTVARGGRERTSPVGIRAAVAVLRRAIQGGPTEARPHVAELILPMDQTGTALEGTQLSIVPRDQVLGVIDECSRALPQLAEWSKRHLSETSAPHFLMLLENFADAGMIGLDDEVAMYAAMVRATVPQGATLILKAHPLIHSPVDAALRDVLHMEFNVVLMPRDLGRYPMELWRELAHSCKVLSVLSYCGISLPYLYGTPTLYPFGEGFIERFFPKRSWDQVREQETVCRGQLANLERWDGRGILWAGDVTA